MLRLDPIYDATRSCATAGTVSARPHDQLHDADAQNFRECDSRSFLKLKNQVPDAVLKDEAQLDHDRKIRALTLCSDVQEKSWQMRNLVCGWIVNRGDREPA